MPNTEITQLIQCLEELSEELSPKTSLEQAILYLLVCNREDYPLTELAERMGWNALKTSREVNALARDRYNGKEYQQGYEVFYTEEDPNNRVFKNTSLTHKGKMLREKIIGILRQKPAKKG